MDRGNGIYTFVSDSSVSITEARVYVGNARVHVAKDRGHVAEAPLRIKKWLSVLQDLPHTRSRTLSLSQYILL